jgi:hypothetical protein
MAKSRARFLSELLGTTGLVKKSKSALAGADEIIDLSTLPSIPNSKLTNSSITINSSATSLGGSVTLTTANVAENTNLYYTDARADARITAADTGDLSEGSNLYYTDARADARVNLQTGSNLNLSSKDTGDLSEGSNLYYTNARADARIAAADTGDLSEGSNLYYTDARADARVALIVDSAPGTLNTLNELAAALGDDANFSTTVTNSIATKLPLAGGTLTGNLSLGDNVKAQFGASDDLAIYHDGFNSHIRDQGTGNLQIEGQSDVKIMDNLGSTTMATFRKNGPVFLAHNNSTKFATTSTGIDVTGTATMDGLTTDDDVSGLTTLGRYSSGFAYSLLRPSASATGLEIRTNAGNALAHFLNDGTTKLHHNGSPKIATTATGADITGVLTADEVKVGATDRIYLDGGSNTYIQESASDDLRFFVGGQQAVRVRTFGTDILGTVTADGLVVDGNNDIQINRDGLSSAKIFWNRSGTTDAKIELDASENLTIAVDEAQLGSKSLVFKNNNADGLSISSSQNVNIPNGKIKVSANTAPVARVDIAGNSDTVPALKIGSGDTYGHFFYDSGATGDLVIKRGEGGSQSESMRLDRSTGAATFSGTISSGVITASGNISAIGGYLLGTTVYNSGDYTILNNGGTGWHSIVERGNGDNYTVKALGGFKIGNNIVIDTSRNLTNIGSITANDFVTENNVTKDGQGPYDWVTVGAGGRAAALRINDIAGANYIIRGGGYGLRFMKHVDAGTDSFVDVMRFSATSVSDTTADVTITNNLSVGGTLSSHTITTSGDININTANDGLYFLGTNNRIYFNNHRAMEGSSDASNLQIGEGYTTTNIYSNLSVTSGHNIQVSNNSAFMGTNVAGGARSLVHLDSSNILRIKGNDAEGSSNVISMIGGGNVGIGTTSPTQKLDVAGTALVENAKLKAIAESNTDTAVDVFVYDTRKDSDGGAWRKRTQNTSWYNETLNTSTRGARKEFPSVAILVLEARKLRIYDGDDPDMPFWMQFDVGGSNAFMTMLNRDANDLASVEALNGVMGVGALNQNNHSGGLRKFNFIADYCYIHDDNSTYTGFHRGGGIANRNSQVGNVPNTSGRIVARNVNDVAMTVLPNAPIDADTGLPVPTIAVGTDGGVSVIKDDGSVYDISGYNWAAVSYQLAFDANGILYFSQRNYATIGCDVKGLTQDYTSMTDGRPFYNSLDTYPFFQAHGEDGNGWGSGLVDMATGSGRDFDLAHYSYYTAPYGRVVRHQTNHDLWNAYRGDSDLMNYTSDSYNTGWMHGDIKLATLSDTDDTNVTGSELITNGTTFSNTTGWTSTTATVSVSGGELVVTGTASSPANQSAGFTTITGVTAGEVYVLTFDITEKVAASGAAGITVGGAKIKKNSDLHYWYPNNVGTYSTDLVATGTSISINMHAGTNVGVITKFDNISLRRAEEDRSVNGNGLQVFGTIAKDPVATGADLVGYDFGSSNSNYFKVPYNSSIASLGTSWTFVTWIHRDTTSGWDFMLSIDGPSAIHGAGIKFDSNQTLMVSPYQGYSHNTSASSTSNAFGNDLDWQMIAITCNGSTTSFYRNGKLSSSHGKAPSLSLPDSTYYLTIGSEAEHSTGGPVDGRDKSMALLRLSATVATAEQIAKIYNDEKHLFQENAKATLYGSSDAVTALAYDDDTELLHVGTSAGRSVFQGLNRVNNTTDAVGAAISASNGFIVEE